MNSLKAIVTNIDNIDSLNIVNFDFFGESLSMMSLDLDESIQVGVNIELTAKPTHIAIAKEFSGAISYSNQIKAKIVSIQNGQLLSSVTLKIKDSTLESIITLASSKRMNLRVGDEVKAFIKASDISIVRVL